MRTLGIAAHLLMALGSISLPAYAQSNQALRYNYEYSCNKERIVIGHCRKDSDMAGYPPTKPEDDYCQAYYPDRPKMGGFEAFGIVLRGDVVKTLQACGALSPAPGQASRSAIDDSVAEFRVGETYYRSADYVHALEHFKKSNTIAPSSAAYIMSGIAQYQLKMYPDAIVSLKQTIKMAPDNPEAHYWLGMALRGSKEYTVAESEFSNAVRLKPDYQVAYTWLGLTLYLEKKYPEAVAALQRSIRIKPDDASALFSLGLVYFTAGQKEKATEVYNTLSAIDPKTAADLLAEMNKLTAQTANKGAKPAATSAAGSGAQATASAAQDHLNKANQFFNDRDFDKSIAEYQAIIALKPEKKLLIEAYEGLAATYDFDLDLKKEIAAYIQLTALNPADSSTFWVLGDLYFKTLQYAKAAAAYKESIRLDPSKTLYYSSLAHAYLMLGQKAEAMRVYNSLLTVDKDSAKNLLEQINDPGGPATVLAHEAEVLLLNTQETGGGEKATALVYLQAARLIKPANPYGLMKVGEAYSLWDQYDDAIAAYRSVIALKPKPETQAEAFGDIGQAYNGLDQYAKAIPELKQSLRLKPDDYMTRELGNSYFGLKDYTNALAAYQEAVKLKPDNADGHFLVGMTYAAMNQPDLSIAAFGEVARLEPRSGRGFTEIGKIHLQQKRYNEAGRSFSSALRIDPKTKAALYGIGQTYLAVGRKPEAMRAYNALKPLDEKLAQQLLDEINKK